MSNLAQEAILRSFVKLISEKPFDKITVKEIIDDCQIARRTFYYHFQDLYAVIEELLKLEAEKAIREYRQCGSWEDSFILAAHFILENRRAVYHLYNSEHRDELIMYIDKLATEIMDRYLDEQSDDRAVDASDRMLIGLFYRHGLTGLVCDWLEEGMKSDPEEAIRRLGKLFGGSIERALKTSLES